MKIRMKRKNPLNEKMRTDSVWYEKYTQANCFSVSLDMKMDIPLLLPNTAFCLIKEDDGNLDIDGNKKGNNFDINEDIKQQ